MDMIILMIEFIVIPMTIIAVGEVIRQVIIAIKELHDEQC